MKIKKETKSKGFSLIEIVVSIAIFSLIVGGIVLFGVRTIQAHTKSQAMQNALENSRFAIEVMSKRIRTSLIPDGENDVSFSPTDRIFIVDNFSGLGYCYRFRSDALQMAEDVSDCNGGGFVDLVSASDLSVDGFFRIVATDETSAKRGFVTIVIKIKHPKDYDSAAPEERDSVTVQSSVSLRDY